MMDSKYSFSAYIALSCCLAATAVSAQGLHPPPGRYGAAPIGVNAPALTPVERIGDGLLRIGKVTVDKKAKLLSFPAKVNMSTGLLEYVLVRTGGKTHESLLRTDAEPYDIQLACLLLDLNGSDRPLPYQGAPELPTGDPVKIQITLDNGTPVSPEKWVTKISDKQAQEAPPINWMFTGSWINQGRFMAQVDGSIIALYHDPVAIIDNASPGGESDRIWFVDKNAVPPAGTPVTVTIQVAK